MQEKDKQAEFATPPDILAFIDAPTKEGCETRTPVIDHETFCIHWKGKTCKLRNGKPFKLFERLSRRPGKYVSIRLLMEDVWHDVIVEDNTVQKAASRLQEALRNAGMAELVIDGRTNPGYYALVIGPSECQ